MLYADYLTNEKKSMNKWVHYFPAYERSLQKFVNQSVTLIEIGVSYGGSLQMWKRFLGPFATIIGVDIQPGCKQQEEDQIHVRIGDQSDTKFLAGILDEFGAPDIVIDDGSHMMPHINATFDYLFDKVSKNGVYIVEDLLCAYLDQFEGGLKRENTFIEKSKDLIDSLYARYNGLPTSFADSTYAMTFIDSMVIFEKKQWPRQGVRAFSIPDVPGRQKNWENRLDKLKQLSKGRTVVLWGYGVNGRRLESTLMDLSLDYRIVDEYKQKNGQLNGVPGAMSLEELNSKADKYFVVITPTTEHPGIRQCLDEYGYVKETDYMEFFVGVYI